MVSLPPPPPELLEGAALFLDFDGTLVDLADRPGDIRVEPALHPLLERLRHRVEGRLAIISGRSLADLDRHLQCSGLFVSGSHGIELRRPDALVLPLSVPDELDEIRSTVALFAKDRPGLLVEEKPAGIALHYRLAPEEKEQAETFMSELAHAHGLAAQKGKMVIELRPRGPDKGDALRFFMAEPAFVGTRPVFVGDDLTDEHGFEAAAALSGAGVLVGPERNTAAHFRLPGVAAVAEWLRKAL